MYELSVTDAPALSCRGRSRSTRNFRFRVRVIVPLAALLMSGISLAAPPAGKPAEAAGVPAEAVSISNVKVEIRDVTGGSYKGNKYLRIYYTATPNQSIAPKMRIKIRGVLKTASGTYPDDITSLIAIDTLGIGESKTHNSPLFMSKGLPGEPKSCELSFSLARILDKHGDHLATFCWNGTGVSPGPCK